MGDWKQICQHRRQELKLILLSLHLHWVCVQTMMTGLVAVAFMLHLICCMMYAVVSCLVVQSYMLDTGSCVLLYLVSCLVHAGSDILDAIWLMCLIFIILWCCDHLIVPEEAQRAVPNVQTKLLRDFVADQSWQLLAGDMLYLPPRVPHRGR